jgi:pimeloyl-ACP methyl ester carboxylesterase
MEIKLNGSTLFYKKTGSGVERLLLFHGFGMDHSAFTSIAEDLSAQFTCYSFDLFFHGKSYWNNGETPLSMETWSLIMTKFFQTERITRFSVLGYSIGARFALGTFMAFPSKTARIILLAPDGIEVSLWYKLAVYPLFTRMIFRQMIRRPFLFDSLTRISAYVTLIHPAMLRFAASQMSTAEKRGKVYNTWVVFRHLRFKRAELVKKINDNACEVSIYFASEDRMIKRNSVESFAVSLKNCRLSVLNTSHHQLISAVAAVLRGDLTIQNGSRR